MGDTPELLTDDQVLSFICNGYHLVETDFPAAFHASVLDAIAHLTHNPGNEILQQVPQLQDIYDHPKVRGALISLLGRDVQMNGHRHLHTTEPRRMSSQNWHQDGTNVRHHQVWCCLAMYYPQDVEPEMGPTAILPGSHFRNAPTDRMAAYANIRGQVFLTVKAGTVAITHYDLWHAASLNRSDRPRHMLKFLFDRKKSPGDSGGPSWNHAPPQAAALAQQRVMDMVGPPIGYSSDLYKEWELRREMWEWLCGKPRRLPAGAFKDMLA